MNASDMDSSSEVSFCGDNEPQDSAKYQDLADPSHGPTGEEEDEGGWWS